MYSNRKNIQIKGLFLLSTYSLGIRPLIDLFSAKTHSRASLIVKTSYVHEYKLLILLEPSLTNFEFRIMFICAYVNLYHSDFFKTINFPYLKNLFLSFQ